MFDTAILRELIELIGKSMTFTDIETMGADIFKTYNTHDLENVSQNMSISPQNAAKRLIYECDEKNKLKDLLNLIINLDGNLLNGRTVNIPNMDNLLYRLTNCGYYFDFNRRKLIDFNKDKKHLINWGVLRDGKEYPIIVASIDICDNSSMVAKYKPKIMEKVYYELWEYLNNKLHDYSGRIWSWAGDGGIMAFRNDNARIGSAIISSVRCCLEILLSLPIFNARPEKPVNDELVVRIGMDCGKIKFYSDTGRIVSDVINYAAHLEKKGTKPYGLSVSEDIHKKLPPLLKKLFKTKQEFEGKTAYSLVYNFNKALS